MRASTLAIPLLVLSACADAGSDEPQDPCLLRSASRCDVRESDCQEHAHEVIACIRGTDHPLPAIEVMTAEEYAAAHPPGPSRTPEEQRLFDQYVRAYQLLWLLPDGWEEPEPSPVAAPYISYDSARDTIVVIADGTQPEFELYGLLYTLVLAARDRESDLDGLMLTQTGTFDSKRALVALFAGEATFFADMARARELDYGELAQRFSYEKAIEETRHDFASPSVEWGVAMALFQYYYGANYVLGAFLDGGQPAVDALYDDSLASTAYALAGDGDIDAAFSAIDVALPAPPEGFRYLSQDSYGPAMLQIHLTREYGLGSEAADKTLARTWVGDRLVIAVNDSTDAVAVVWQIAGPGGEVRSTIVRSTDIDAWNAFEALFGG
ncbi:hypothetical protein [Nannocystis punicea]|uniref:Uncharacterized protein n=1 Tax=Nannocystis punicea TaxID=2995304 RepID=A0ABY7GXK7_9BACT|nr:hypothetical protein [Nannocystis poenicansa]WAS91709.1 hypothetical protein O0S08_36470 [Nannocystis poenicansa]